MTLPWRLSRAVVLSAVAMLGLSQCATEACGCTPAVAPAVIIGRVLGGFQTPVHGARVRAYSAPAAGCRSVDADFGGVLSEADGSFFMPLSTTAFQDSVCVLVFARPPFGASSLENSDTALLVMSFLGSDLDDTARVELVLRSLP